MGVSVVVTTQPDSGVTIQLKEKSPSGNPPTKTYDGNDKITITVTRYPYPGEGSDFLKFTHTPNGQSFTLAKVLGDGGNPISGIPLTGPSMSGKVGLVAAYYWRYELDNALLIGIYMDSGTTQYYRSDKSGTWSEYKDIKTPVKEPTRDELDLLNCEINDVVQIDVSRTEGPYCHKPGDSPSTHKEKKVKVEKVQDFCQLRNYTAYLHVPNPKAHYGINLNTFNISGFKNGNNEVRLNSLSLPIKDATRVIVYMCEEVNRTPLLIYYSMVTNKLDGFNTTHHWYKNSNGKTPDHWTAEHELSKHGPGSYGKIRGVLDCLDSRCKPKLAPPIPSSQVATATLLTSPDARNSQDSTSVIKTFSYVTTGVLTASGSLTGFAYLLYKNTRDPWVRQI
ncbi:hypothetical protein BEWA_014330 [Theileria equi strain WA]|uniref:Uncharacterized protein n=1 Tax=Theileria equi strain WA TaxID=1537102 RepID=L1LC69_THEEQ|nr:hypothetical protein BEWA_014330 [Theileria equi strain WA]EKX72874.1 hypothetical protein BEWA_014330 [Theileria equi strain WA]|eukprot:XP_004832326.1 hypothetical protein BEWA_014330 [Theileria equi strain WA]